MNWIGHEAMSIYAALRQFSSFFLDVNKLDDHRITISETDWNSRDDDEVEKQISHQHRLHGSARLSTRYFLRIMWSRLGPSIVLPATVLVGGAPGAGPFHRTLKPFYITLPRRQKHLAFVGELRIRMVHSDDPVSFESGPASWEYMVSDGRVHFTLSQNIMVFCIKSQVKKDLFQTTWTKLYLLFIRNVPLAKITEVNFFIH